VHLTAIFETWHIGDGNYPPLRTNQLVNLSFEFQPDSLSNLSSPNEDKFEHIVDAEYSFAGKVLKRYLDPPDSHIVVIQAAGFRFYINSIPKGSPVLREGDKCQGRGRLLFDHYIWVEFLSGYKDPPDLFYRLRVIRLRSVKISEKFISRYPTGMSGPASLDHENYSGADISEVERMENVDEDWRFFLVDFDDSDVGKAAIPLTFHGRAT
jgi:hypothetical protein